MALATIETLERIVVSRHQLLIKRVAGADSDDAAQEIRIARSSKIRATSTLLEGNSGLEGARNEGLIQSIVRAHVWVRYLQDGNYESIEALATANHLHPKVVRLALRLAFLSPDVTSAALEGSQPAALPMARIPTLLPVVLERASALARLMFSLSVIRLII